MNIQIDGKNWRFAFDKDITLEVITALFATHFNETNGNVCLLLDDLIQYLFYIDMNDLCDRYSIVTGASYYFNGEGKLRSGELYKLLNDNNNNLFTIYNNIYNRTIVKINSFNDISNDHLCVNTEELINDVYYNDDDLTFSKAQFDELFNTDIAVTKGLDKHISYITLDYLIDNLPLVRNAVIEDLALHNFRLS